MSPRLDTGWLEPRRRCDHTARSRLCQSAAAPAVRLSCRCLCTRALDGARSAWLHVMSMSMCVRVGRGGVRVQLQGGSGRLGLSGGVVRHVVRLVRRGAPGAQGVRVVRSLARWSVEGGSGCGAASGRGQARRALVRSVPLPYTCSESPRVVVCLNVTFFWSDFKE